jgi:hypothetical protein
MTLGSPIFDLARHKRNTAWLRNNQWVDRPLAERLHALPDAAMRKAVLTDSLRRMEAAAVVGLLGGWLRVARTAPDVCTLIALTTLASVLGAPHSLPLAAREAIYASAKAAGEAGLTAILLWGGPEPDDVPPPPGPERPLIPRGRPLTLGERKALARRPRGRDLPRLLADPDAQVIRIVLDNPNTIERDVVTIAARRPTRGEIARTVFESRWLARPIVRLALAQNPYTPGDLALALLPTLGRGDLAQLAQEPSLAPARRRAAAALLSSTLTP